MGRSVLAVLIMVATTIMPTATTAEAGEPPGPGEITIWVIAAPDVVEGLMPRLVLEADDLTDAFCDDPRIDTSFATSVTISCTGLSEGTYDVDVVGLDPSLSEHTVCEDLLASSAQRPRIDVDNAYTAWTCSIFVGTPAIITTIGALGGPRPTGWSFAPFTDDTAVECVDDVYNRTPATRCRNLAPGAYALQIVGPLSELGEMVCLPVFAGTSVPYSMFVTITETEWLWWCGAFAPSNVQLNVFGNEADSNVFDGPVSIDVSTATPLVVGPDGPVGDACLPGSFGAPYRVEYVCLLPPGSYTVEWQGLPEGEFVPTCTTFDVGDNPTEATGCDLRYQVPDLRPLPETGSFGTHIAGLAGVVMLLGFALRGIARRGWLAQT